MNRFAAISASAALAGSLFVPATAANALSELYMVPISPLNVLYSPGDTVHFAAVLDLNTSLFVSPTIPFAAAFTGTEFNADIANKKAPFVDGQPTQKDPNNPQVLVFNKNT